MEDDNRPDANSEEDESDAGWYFDLPNGAWERQEAKNRELRQNVRRNIDETEPKKDVFGGPVRGGLDFVEEELPAGWGVPAATDEDVVEAVARAEASLEAGPPGEPVGEDQPPVDSPAPFKLRSRGVAEEGGPELPPRAGLFGHAADESRADERIVQRRDRSEEAAASHRPRWDEVFGERDDEDSMREGMRRWAGRASSGTEEDPSPSGYQESEEAERAPVTPFPLRVQQHAAEPKADDPPAESQTRWDQMFSTKAADDAGMLDGMRSWASKREEPSEPRPRLAPDPQEHAGGEVEPVDWESDVRAGAPEPIRLHAPAPEPAEKKGLLGKLFGKKKKDEESAAGPAPGGPQQTWLDDDAPGESSAGRGDWLGRADGGENRFPSAPVPGSGNHEWVPEEEASQAARSSGWALADDDGAQRPRFPRMESAAREDYAADDTEPVIGALSTADPAESWSPEPTTEDEEHFSELSTWFANRNAQSAPEATEPDAGELQAAAGASGAGEPLESRAPAALGENATTDESDAWSPEPFAAAGDLAVPSAAEDGVEPQDVTAWADDESEPEARPSGFAAVADEDPWASADSLDASAADVDTSTVPAPSVIDVAAVPPGAVLAPGDDAADDESGDAWATFIRGRLSDDDVPAETRMGAPAAGGLEAFTESVAPDEASWDEADAPTSPDEAPLAPAAATSLWDTAFEHMQEPGPGAAEDDSGEQWAATTPATEYPDRPAASRPSPFEFDSPAYEDVDDDVDDFAPLSQGTALRADGPVMSRPAWDEAEVDDDTVLRAFEAHAAGDSDFDAGLPPSSETQHLPFDELLGEDAEDIVAEASQPSVESRYFARSQGFAPQRAPGSRQPYPWEQDLDEPRNSGPGDAHASDDWGTIDQAPPWSTEPEPAGAGHADAPSVRRKSRSRMLVREIVETGLLALLVFLSVRASFQNFKVDGYSMWPTLDDGEYLIVNKLAYAEVDMDRLSNFVPFVDPGDDPTREIFGGPERGDIVVLKDPRETDTDLIKRIVGMPGETLEIVDGKVYINDQLLLEPYIKEEWRDDKEKIAIPGGYYFVMGDNRNNSMDSRSSSIALIPQDLIIGKAMLTYWPRNRFGLAPNEAGDISEKDGRPVVTTERVPE